MSADQSSKDVNWNDIMLWLDAFRGQSGSTLYKERAQGTCKWIYDKQPFNQWKASENSAGLWIFGKPGMDVYSDYLPRNNLD